MRIPFNQVNAYIVNSAKPIYTHIISYKPSIPLGNYVKSQLHVNIVTDLYGRSITNYMNAYLYLQGDERHFASFKQVVKWYYQDLSNLILNSIETLEEDFSILYECNIPQKHLSVSEISIKRVQQELTQILIEKREVDSPQFNYFNYLAKVPLSCRDTLKPTQILSEALAMAYVADTEVAVIDVNK